MTNRERLIRILHYEDVDRLPIVHFGFLRHTLDRWASEGHITTEEAENHADSNAVDTSIGARLGFDFNYQTMFRPVDTPMPGFESKVIRTLPDGMEHVQNGLGVVVVRKTGAKSIPGEIDHLLKDRNSWESLYKERMKWSPERVENAGVCIEGSPRIYFGPELKARLEDPARENPVGLHCGSLYGLIRSIVGLENLSYLLVDDEPLLDELIETFGELSLASLKMILEAGYRFDLAHFWEDICFKNGPLVNPSVFRQKVGPYYRRITDLVGSYGIDIVSLDCDGKIDDLVPVWLDNGVNTMFPIEVGTWKASIEPWRKQYGKELRGVGGMEKKLFGTDRGTIDKEIERLRRLVDLGGYVPCPDHRIAEDAEWELVQYYCDRMRRVFG